LGENILGTDFSFDIRINKGAGMHLFCGESSALFASIEGRAEKPRAKYVHAVERGLWGQTDKRSITWKHGLTCHWLSIQ
jgi:NADH:ubiquinone oxidoreductase subunit F (NADH-binding)